MALVVTLLVIFAIESGPAGSIPSFYAYLMPLGILTLVLLVCCTYGALYLEYHHRWMFFGYWSAREQLTVLQNQLCVRQTIGMTSFDSLLHCLTDCGNILSNIDVSQMPEGTGQSMLSLYRLQQECMTLVTSRQDLYTVSPRKIGVPEAVSRLYGIAEDLSDEDSYSSTDNPCNEGESLETLCGSGDRKSHKRSLTTSDRRFTHHRNSVQSDEAASDSVSVHEPTSTRAIRRSNRKSRSGPRPLYLDRGVPVLDIELPRVHFEPPPSSSAELDALLYAISPVTPTDDNPKKEDRAGEEPWTLPAAGAEGGEVHLLSQVGRVWQLDLIKIDDSTNHMGLVRVGLEILKRHCEKEGILKVEVSVMERFLLALQRQYRTANVYHNHVHASMVGHLVICLSRMLGLGLAHLKAQGTMGQTLISSGSRSRARTNVAAVDEVVLCVAALGHDVGHPGRSNAFFVHRGEPLALLYNDMAVLENYHSYLTFLTLTGNGCNIFAKIPGQVYRHIRKRIIELILATDISTHFALMSTVRARRTSPDFDILENEEDKWMVARLCIKIADVGHAAVDWPDHWQWSMRVCEEFYVQADEELARGMVVSPLCDRSKRADLPKCQGGFITFVVLPLLEEIEFVCSRSELLSGHARGQEDGEQDESVRDPVVSRVNVIALEVSQRARQNSEQWKVLELANVSAIIG
eukprot:GHVS01086298.1.p1 GENE.GHVS01086298.1~~GHVS01086298.1.p1  ORF type:complete len:747 (+),score=71.77 GHVS01086298.1:173-2242(+)